jgi:hypothetical protein
VTAAVQCHPWPVAEQCLPEDWHVDPAEWPEEQRAGMDVATAILNRATAGLFQQCTVTVRPCPAMPAPAGYRRAVAGCDPPSCDTVSDIALTPNPVLAVHAVKVDGQLLEPSMYAVHNAYLLVRLGGPAWPAYQNLALPDTEPGTWSVTYEYGRRLPADGRVAVTRLAIEAAKACTGRGDCALSQRVTEIVRQGITVTLDNLDTIREGGTGLPLVDRWVASVNPGRARLQPTVYTPDEPPPRLQT